MDHQRASLGDENLENSGNSRDPLKEAKPIWLKTLDPKLLNEFPSSEGDWGN
jgi:hypothetical protein